MTAGVQAVLLARSATSPARWRGCRTWSSRAARPPRRPARGGVAGRRSRRAGCARPATPSARRPTGASLPTRVLYASNGSRVVEPAGPEQHRPGQHDHRVRRQPGGDDRQGGPLGGDEFQPDEREQAGGGGPPAERCRAAAAARRCGSRRAAMRGEQVHCPQRVERPPDRAEQQRQRHQPDPEQDVEHAGRRVVGGVRPDEQTHAEPGGGEQAEPAQRPPATPARRRSGEPRAAPGAAGGVPVEPGFAPQRAERHERDDEGQRGGDDELRQRDRQVLAAADAVCQQRGSGRHSLSGRRAGRAPARTRASPPRTARSCRRGTPPSRACRPAGGRPGRSRARAARRPRRR